MPNIRVKPELCLEKAALDFKLVVKEAETKKPTTERGFTEKSICITGQWAKKFYHLQVITKFRSRVEQLF